MRFRALCAVLGIVGATLSVGGVAPNVVNAASCQAPTPLSTPDPALPATGFHAITPVRLLDTRNSGAVLGAGCTAVLDLATAAAIPTDAQALALNVTTVNAEARGFVTVYPCGSARPATSNANPRTADASANSVLVQVDSTRTICIYTLTALHLVVDATGWFGRFGAPFHATASTRLLDTRTALRPDTSTGPLAAETELRLPVVGSVVPAEARAVAVNVTVTDALLPGFVTAYPCGGQRPPTSTVNFQPGEQRANHVVLGLDGGGAICLSGNVAVHVIVDVEGWFGAELTSGSMFQPLLGTRVLDTRDGTGAAAGKLTPGATLSFDPSLGAHLPLGDTVVLSVVATQADTPGYITMYPCSTTQPSTSAVNAVVGTEATNVAFVTVDSASRICLFTLGPLHVVVDVVGTFGAGGPLHALTINELTLGQTFSPDATDYTVRCSSGMNTLTVHAVGAPGATVSIAPAGQPAPAAVSQTADAALSLPENAAVVVRAGAPDAAPVEYWVRCLPHDFPVMQVTRTVSPNPGWYLTDAAFPTSAVGTDQSRFVMILDNRSVPVWYHRVTDPSIDLTRMSDGNLAWVKILGPAFGATLGAGFEIHALDGTLLRTISTVSGPTDHHDIAELPNGDVILITYVARQNVDLTALGAGYGAHELVYDGHLEEIRPDGSVAWTWKSEDHIPVTASTFPQRLQGAAGVGVDLLHINSVHVAPDGDLIVSARHTDTVYKIRRDTAGTIVYRIGGNQPGAFTFVNDPLGGFGRQHDVQLLPNGHLRLFDNRSGLPGSPRAAEYAIDTTAGTATLVWSRSEPDVTTSFGLGSVRGIGDGDLTVTWGGSTVRTFTEFGPDGSELQSTTMANHNPYRVDKQPVSAFDINVLRATAGR